MFIIPVLAFLLVFTCCTPAFALPTPDVLVNVFQVLPLITGSFIGIMVGLGGFLRKRFSKSKDPISVLIKINIVLFICVLGCLTILTYSMLQYGNINYPENIAMYFRI